MGNPLTVFLKKLSGSLGLVIRENIIVCRERKGIIDRLATRFNIFLSIGCSTLPPSFDYIEKKECLKFYIYIFVYD